MVAARRAVPSGVRGGTLPYMFSYRPSRFGGDGNPWFRIGTFDVGSAGIVSIAGIVGMVLWALEGPTHPVSRYLTFVPQEIVSGQLWRLLSWILPNQPSIWVVLSAAIIYLLGSQLEGILGRVSMAWFLGVLALIPAVGAVFLDLIGFDFAWYPILSLSLLGSSIFYAFVAHMPTVRFFFGIPGWVLAAVFIGIEALSALGSRAGAEFVLLFIRVIGTVMAARAFGLANELTFIPKLSRPRRASNSGSTRQRRSRGSDSHLSVVPPPSVPDTRYEDLDLDAILDQVSELGVDSLTPEQKAKLKSYSRDRKKRPGA